MKKVLCFCLALLTGCGYSANSIIKSGVSSVYVPVFENHTFRRELEFQLTEYVKNEILYKTRLKIVPKAQAESILKGEIVDFRERVLTEDSQDNPREERIFAYVNVQWIDLRTGREIMKRDRLVRPTEFVIEKGETLQTATAESFKYLAEIIVQAMESDW